jgi:hypothetical protein
MAKYIYYVEYSDREEEVFSTDSHKTPYNAAVAFARSNAPSSLHKIINNESHLLYEFWLVSGADGVQTLKT